MKFYGQNKDVVTKMGENSVEKFSDHAVKKADAQL